MAAAAHGGTTTRRQEMEALGRRAKAVAPLLSATPTAAKNRALLAAADGLQSHHDELLDANEADLAAAKEAGISPTLLDRLRLTPARIDGMAGGLRQVAELPDPVGVVVASDVRPNGLRIQQVRVPLGVVAIVYESRPNVTSDAAGLCLKSGNVAFLRGSSMAIQFEPGRRRDPARGLRRQRPARGRPHPGGPTPAARRRWSSCGSAATWTA